MKRLLLFLFINVMCFSGFAFQNQAPWKQDSQLFKKTKIKLEDFSKAAELYFRTIDVNKKGSGLKPYERWKNHWKFYTKDDGTIASSKDLWKAWGQKNALNKKQAKSDESNWAAVGPFQSSNTYSSSSKKSSGQGRVNAIAIDPTNSNTYYIGAPAGGLWKSTDAGVNWTPLTDYLPQIGVSGIAIHPTDSNIIYISTGDDDAGDSYSVGVWKTTDGGVNWVATGEIPGFTGSQSDSMNEIYIDPNNLETVMVATSNGVMKSTNGGGTWTQKLSGNILDLKIKPNDPSIWYAVTSSAFYRSTDGGENFSQVSLPGLEDSGRLTMDVTKANDNYVYIVSSKNRSNNYSFNGIYKSTDSGASFTKTNETSDIFQSSQAWFDLSLTVSDQNPDIVYVGVLDIWKSTDGGDDFTKLTTWFLPDSDSFTHADIHFMRFIDGKFLAGTDGGIYISTNEGVNFTDLSENLSISQFYKISVSQKSSSIITGGLQDNGGFTYNNQKWVNYHGGDGMEGIVDPSNYEIHYGFIQYGGRLYKTVNNGTSLSFDISAPAAERDDERNDSGGEWVTPLALNSKSEILAGYSQLYKLVDDNWSKLSNHSFGGDLDNIEIDPNDDNVIYVSQANNVFKSIDGGLTFNKLAYLGPNINDIEISTSDSNVLWIITNSSIFKSTNSKSENPVIQQVTKNNTPSESKITIVTQERSNNNTVYLGTSLGVYYTNDDIDEWVVFDNNLPNVAVRDLEINEDDAKLFAATYGRGVFVSDIPRTLPSFDISLISATSTNLINCGSSASPKVTVKNLGTSSISSFTINYSIDGGENNTYAWNGNLDSNQTIDISFPAVNSSVGNHTMTLEAVLTDDAYSSNNKGTLTFTTNDSSSDPTTVNSFESNEDQLLVQTSIYVDQSRTLIPTSNNLWVSAAPSKTLLNSAATGTKAYITGASGNYPDKTTSYLYTNCYDLTTISNPVMSFKMAFDIEFEWDYLVVEYSTDSGNTWSVLGTSNDPNWYNSSATTDSSNTATLPGKQWTGEGENANPLGGTNATIHDYSYDLASLKDETNIIFRFNFTTDDAANEEGVMIDDFVINGTLSVNDVELQNNFSVYPNPSEDVFNISWPNDNNGTTNISVYNYLGKKIFEQKNVKEKSYQINLAKQSKGLYFIKLNIDGKQAVKKVIIK